MTIEEAIEKEKSIAKSNHELANSYHTDFNVYMRQEVACRERAEYHEQVAEWLEELQRLKEQEPCDDCMSRQAMLDAITKIDDGTNMDIYTNEVREIVKALPPVTPTFPKGTTNGDMIKAMFPNIEIEGIGGITGLECVAVSIGLGISYFALDWWSAPYKAESEVTDADSN